MKREPIPARQERIPGRSSVFLVSRAAVMLLALAISGCALIPRGLPASDGLLNFGRVNAALFRGAQPDESAIASLQRLGVRTIINLRLPGDTWTGEEASARAHGLVYVSVPLRGMGAPTDAQVAQALALIASSPPPVFVHCEHGADRTGTVIACYRIQHDDWSAAAALAEADTHGFSAFQFGMRRFIPRFSPLAPASPSAHKRIVSDLPP